MEYDERQPGPYSWMRERSLLVRCTGRTKDAQVEDGAEYLRRRCGGARLKTSQSLNKASIMNKRATVATGLMTTSHARNDI